MEELKVYKVWATYTHANGKKGKGPVSLAANMAEAVERLAGARHTYTIAQEYGEIKHFTLHLEEQHLEPSKKEA